MVEEWRDSIAHPVEIYCSHVPSLKWPEIERIKLRYTGVLSGVEIDTLMVLFTENRNGVTIDADEYGDLMFQYNPETGDVIGLHIEDFESYFLIKNQEFADGWAALKPEGKNGKHKTPWLTDAVALDYARRLKDMAYQATLAPGWPFEDFDSIAVKDGSIRRPSP